MLVPSSGPGASLSLGTLALLIPHWLLLVVFLEMRLFWGESKHVLVSTERASGDVQFKDVTLRTKTEVESLSMN